MTKKESLDALELEMTENETLPLRESRLVFGEGNIDAEVLFIGEAPGFHEDQQGRPFVGRGGKLLDDCIQSIGWKRADVYITNIVKRRPPENRDPTPEEIAAYKPYLTRQIEIINPRAIVPLGRFSMNYFLPQAKISLDHGKAFSVSGRIVVPMYHPAAALRGTRVMNEFRGDFKKLPAIISGDVKPEVVELSEAESQIKNTAQTQLF
jgi:DNA polymerase